MGEVNGDGKIDLVVTSFSESSYCGSYGCYNSYDDVKVKVLLGNGDETFNVGNERELNHDTILDISTANSGSNKVVVLLAIGDDKPQISINSGVSRVEGNTGTSPLTSPVVLSRPYDLPVTVSFATADGSALAGSDFVATAGSLTFAPGQTSRNIAVSVIGDVRRENDEYFSVHLSNATNRLIENGSGFGTIISDDRPLQFASATLRSSKEIAAQS